jgi:hypothetical protein
MSRCFETWKLLNNKLWISDPNVERRYLVRRTLENGISCYRMLYEIVETTFDKYFSRKLHPFFTRSVSHILNKRFFNLLAFYYSLYFCLCTQLKRILIFLTNVLRHHG